MRFLWTNKEADLAPYSVFGLVLQVRDAETFPQVSGFENFDFFFSFPESESRVNVLRLQMRVEVTRDL